MIHPFRTAIDLFQELLKKMEENHEEEMAEIAEIKHRLTSMEEESKKAISGLQLDAEWTTAEGQSLKDDLLAKGVTNVPVQTRQQLIELDKVIIADPKNYIPRIVSYRF